MGVIEGYKTRGRLISLPDGIPIFAHADRLRDYFGLLLAIPEYDPDPSRCDEDGQRDVTFRVITSEGKERLGGSRPLVSGKEPPVAFLAELGRGARRLREDAQKPGADPVLQSLARVLRFPNFNQQSDLWRIYKLGLFKRQAAVCWGVEPKDSREFIRLAQVAEWAGLAPEPRPPRVPTPLPPTPVPTPGPAFPRIPWWALALLLLLAAVPLALWLMKGDPRETWEWRVKAPTDREDLVLEDSSSRSPRVRVKNPGGSVKLLVKLEGQKYFEGRPSGNPLEKEETVLVHPGPPPREDWRWWIDSPSHLGELRLEQEQTPTPVVKADVDRSKMTGMIDVRLLGWHSVNGVRDPEPRALHLQVERNIAEDPDRYAAYFWWIAKPEGRELSLDDTAVSDPVLHWTLDPKRPTEWIRVTLQGWQYDEGRTGRIPLKIMRKIPANIELGSLADVGGEGNIGVSPSGPSSEASAGGTYQWEILSPRRRDVWLEDSNLPKPRVRSTAEAEGTEVVTVICRGYRTEGEKRVEGPFTYRESVRVKGTEPETLEPPVNGPPEGERPPPGKRTWVWQVYSPENAEDFVIERRNTADPEVRAKHFDPKEPSTRVNVVLRGFEWQDGVLQGNAHFKNCTAEVNSGDNKSLGTSGIASRMIPQYHLVEGQKDSEGRIVTPSNFDETSDEAGWFSGEPPRSYRPPITTSFQLNFEMRHYNPESKEFLDFPKGAVPVTVRPGERKQE